MWYRVVPGEYEHSSFKGKGSKIGLKIPTGDFLKNESNCFDYILTKLYEWYLQENNGMCTRCQNTKC
jgi:hypothetical protein